MDARSPVPKLAAPLGNVDTSRLRLERFDSKHKSLLRPVFAKQEVWHFPYGRGFDAAETDAFVDRQIAEWEKYGLGCWVATEKANGRTIGYCGLSVPHFLPNHLPAVEVGWRLDPDAWGNGFATEAASAALDEALGTLGLDKVCSAPQAVNSASYAVCERLGMTNTGIVEASGNAKRGPVDVLLYWITNDEWKRHPLSNI